jgi:hypothetical protein
MSQESVNRAQDRNLGSGPSELGLNHPSFARFISCHRFTSSHSFQNASFQLITKVGLSQLANSCCLYLLILYFTYPIGNYSIVLVAANLRDVYKPVHQRSRRVLRVTCTYSYLSFRIISIRLLPYDNLNAHIVLHTSFYDPPVCYSSVCLIVVAHRDRHCCRLPYVINFIVVLRSPRDSRASFYDHVQSCKQFI